MGEQPFAKLFDTPHGQLLVYLCETDDGDPAIRAVGADLNDVRPQAVMSGWPDGEAEARRQFDKIDQAAAEEQAAMLRATITRYARGESV